MSYSKKFLFTATALLFASKSFALNLQSYRFTDSYRYSLLDDSLKEKFDGRYVVTASYGYVNAPLYYSDTYLHDHRKDIIEGNHVLTTGFTYYLHERVAVGIDLNAIHNNVFDDSYTDLADSVLKAKFNLHRTEDFSFSLNPEVIIPTGNRENFSSMGSVSGAIKAVAEKSFNRFHILASLGALSSKNNAYVEVDHRQLLLAQLGLSYDVTDKFNLNVESYRNIPLVDDVYQDEGKYFLTGKHKTHPRLSTYFGVGAAGPGEVQLRSYSAFAGIKFHEAPVVASTVTMAQAAPKRSVPLPKDEVYYAHDRYEITEKETGKLNDYLDYYNENQNDIESIMIEGYASRVGLPAYNMKLGQKRANSVKDYFVDEGIREDLIKTKSYGDTAPQVPEVGRNRKVKINFKERGSNEN